MKKTTVEKMHSRMVSWEKLMINDWNRVLSDEVEFDGENSFNGCGDMMVNVSRLLRFY